MALKVYVSTDKASYFKTNVLRCEENPPTEGSYKVGDIVISSTQENDIFGWVCIKSGEPGIWKNISDVYEVKQDLITHETEINRINNMIELMEQLVDEMYLDIAYHDKKIKEIEANSINTDNTLQLGIEKNVEDINKLNERLSDIEGDVIDIVKNNIFDAVGDLEGVFSESVKQLQNDVTKLHGDVENNIKNISNLRKDVNNNISSIGNLNDQMGGVVSDVNNIKININNITSDVNNIKNNIGDIVGNLEGEFNESVKQIQNQVLKNTEDIANINAKLNNFEKVHTQIQDRIDINTTAIGNINTTISTLDDSIELVEGNVERLQLIVNGLQNTIASTNEKLTQIDKNTTSINSIKQGLIDALINKGVDADGDMSWEDLFNNLFDNLGNNTPSGPESDVVYCTGLSFSQTDIDLTVGDTYNLRSILKMEPENCTEEITWVKGVGYENYVTFDYTTSILTALGEGSIVMQAKCGTQIATVRFDITEVEEPEDDLNVCTSIRFTESSITIKDGQTYNLNNILIIEPEGCTSEVTWSTNSNAVVPVDGIITALSIGSATVKAKCGELTATISVIVEAKNSEDDNTVLDPIYLLRNGTFNNNTAFGNAHPTNLTSYTGTPAIIYPDCLYNLILPVTGYGFITMCFDGLININNYEKIEIVCAGHSNYDTYIAVGVQDNLVEYAGGDSTSFTSLPLNTRLNYTSYKSYTFNTSDLNKSGHGYLTIGMKFFNETASIKIQDIILYPKQRTDGIVLFDMDHNLPVVHEFGQMWVPTNTNNAGFIKDKQGNEVIGFKFTEGMLRGYFCFDGFINFNNYDTIEITAYTENNDQNAIIQVARGYKNDYGYISLYYSNIPNSAKCLSTVTTGKKQPTVYSFSMQELAISSGLTDGNSGYLNIGISRNADGSLTNGDGFVYISKIVVYPEA